MPEKNHNVLKFNKQLFTSDLVKVSLLNGVSTVIKMLTGLVSIKIISTIIGPAGIALLGQLNNFTNIILVFSNGGINSGITKYISEYAKTEKRYTPFLGTGFWISMVFSVILGIAMIFSAGFLATSILHDVKYKSVFYIFGVTIILYSLNAYLTAIINGFKDYKSYIIASILGSLVSFCFSVYLSLQFGIIGALISTVTFQSVVFFLTIFVVRKASWFNIKTLTKSFDTDAAKKLGKFSLMALISAITVPGSQMIVREYITWFRSINEAGLWEGMNRLSIMYLFVVMMSMSVYYVPRLSEIKQKSELRKEVITVYKLMVPFLIFSIIVIYILREFIINLLFSSEFIGMKELFPFQLMGDFLKMCGWLLGSILIAKAMTRIYIIMELVNFVNITVLSYFAVQWQGAWGATIAYAVTHAIYLICLLFVFRKLLFNKEQ